MKKLFILILSAIVCPTAFALDNFVMGDWNKEFYLDYLTALLSENNRHNDQALEYYLKALKTYPESVVLKEDAVLAGLRAGKAGLVSHAAEGLKNINTERARSIYAQYAWSQGNLQTALEYYEKALALDPTSPAVLAQYIPLLSKMDSDRALIVLKKHASLYPEQAAMAYASIGDIYLSRGNVAKALENYEEVSRLAPEADAPYRVRADIYEKNRSYFLALKEYQSLEKMGKATEENYQRMGAINIMLGNMSAAQENFENILKTNPASDTANQFLAALAEGEGDYPAALNYTKAAQDYAVNTKRQLQAAIYASKIPDKQAALDILKGSYNSSKSVEMGYYYAVMLQEENQHKEAVKVLEKIIKQSPDYERAQERLALSLSTLGENRKFEKLIKQLYQKYPDNDGMLNMYGYYLADENKQLDAAESMLDKALSINPEEAAYMDSYGWLLYRKKDYNGALEWLKKAEAEMGEDGELSYHFYMVYKALGDEAKAAEYLKKADKKFLKK